MVVGAPVFDVAVIWLFGGGIGPPQHRGGL
jgi:hypothetical protein